MYRPADEVGGDFFQVMELGDGEVLVVVGDVSGKGLKAAMVVSLWWERSGRMPGCSRGLCLGS
ncbi:MAG: SpoIIE family protein phosphatase [Bryobacterales bacterium]|nr:SpoIIE family protein phosphatase [Bryobacterales bacterium]